MRKKRLMAAIGVVLFLTSRIYGHSPMPRFSRRCDNAGNRKQAIRFLCNERMGSEAGEIQLLECTFSAFNTIDLASAPRFS